MIPLIKHMIIFLQKSKSVSWKKVDSPTLSKWLIVYMDLIKTYYSIFANSCFWIVNINFHKLI